MFCSSYNLNVSCVYGTKLSLKCEIPPDRFFTQIITSARYQGEELKFKILYSLNCHQGHLKPIFAIFFYDNLEKASVLS